MKRVIEILETLPGEYRAWCPALPGCAVDGCAAENACSKMADAVAGDLASFDSPGPEHVEIEVAAGTGQDLGERTVGERPSKTGSFDSKGLGEKIGPFTL